MGTLRVSYYQKFFALPMFVKFKIHYSSTRLSGNQEGRSKLLYRMIEKCILKHSDATVFMSKTAMSRAILRTKTDPEQAHFIYSGAPNEKQFQPKDFNNASSKIILAHFGTLADRRNLNALFQSLIQVIGEQPNAKDFLKVELYGFLDQMVEKSISSFAFKSMISVQGTIEHELALEKMAQSDVLLLIQDDIYVAEETIPSKIYEYLQSNKPVLALVNNEELFKNLLKYNCYCAMIRDQEMIGKEIFKLLNDANEGTLKYPSGQFPNLTLAIDQLLQIKAGLTGT